MQANKNIIRTIIVLMLALWQGNKLFAQPELVDRKLYPFINFEKNKLYIPDSTQFSNLFDELNHLLTVGDKQINIVHIGDSHIQADMGSGMMRQYFQTFFPGGNGGRGFVFPYNIAHTNNPFNYKVSYTGTWTSCRNVQNKDCLLGLAGIQVTTFDTQATVSMSTVDKYGLYYDYTRVRLMFNDADTAYDFCLKDSFGKSYYPQSTKNGIAEWKFKDPIRLVTLSLKRKKANTNTGFILMGLTLETDDPGIIYHSIGVNGAAVISFLKCQLFEEQLNALQPDLIVLSLGANDAYGDNFDSVYFCNSYKKLLQRIKDKNPGVPILLTVPADNYLHHRGNKNNLIVRSVLYTLAKQNGYAVYDLLTVMGGVGSMGYWYDNGMAAKDHVHFSKKGYEVQAGLFFEAFVNAYENYKGTHR
jgi:lysophospholipase L1-like esterase